MPRQTRPEDWPGLFARIGMTLGENTRKMR